MKAISILPIGRNNFDRIEHFNIIGMLIIIELIINKVQYSKITGGLSTLQSTALCGFDQIVAKTLRTCCPISESGSFQTGSTL